MKRLIRRLLLVAGGAVFALVVLEAALQLASLFVGRGAALTGWGDGGRMHVLCIGDSNTYGLMVGRDETWPSQLQKLWNERGGSPPIDVLNIGFPGTNSSQVLRDLDRNLELFEPDLVLLEIGVNDFWTVPVKEAKATEPLLDRIKRWSRVYRLFYMMARRADTPVIEDSSLGEKGGRLVYLGQEFEVGFTATDKPDPRSLESNLEAILARLKARGIRVVLVNYASRIEWYNLVNRLMAKLAEDTSTPIVDLRPVFRDPAVCPVEPCAQWIFPKEHPAGLHPTADGYRLVAKAVADGLERELKRPQ